MMVMKHSTRGGLTAALAAAALAAPAHAQSGDDWRFGLAIYGWFPAIDGQASVPVQTGGATIDASMGDVVDALKFAFMGSFEARKGRWGLFTDLVYADFGAGKQGDRDFTLGGNRLPAGVSADLNLDIKSWIWTFTGLYNLHDTPDATADLLFGGRYIDLENVLSWSFNGDISNLPLPGRSGSGTADVNNWDAIVGVKGQFHFGADRRWYLPYYADVGAGESKLTWQVMGGIGYRFDWGSLIASWRYLDYDFKSSAHVQDLSFSGPLVGVVFRF